MSKSTKLFKNKRNCFVFLSILPFLTSLITGCNNNNYANDSFDKATYDISKTKEDLVNVSIDKIGNNYKLTLSGNGMVKDFSKENKVPWYSIAKKVTKVDIKEGITHLGTELFNKTAIDDIFLPSSLASITNTTFSSDVKLYSYAESVINASNYNIYYYSETKPIKTDNFVKYFRLIDGKPVEWILTATKALFIGNSFTYYNDIPKITEQIANTLGFDLNCESVLNGGHKLEEFANESDEFGKVVYSKLKANNDYDYLILQEQSTRSYDNYDSFKKGTTKLKNLADTTQSSCNVRLYSTWGYASEAKNQNMTIPQLEEKIRGQYTLLANELNISVHQVGMAFSKAYVDYPDINLYHTDNKHPSYAGSYLSALIHVGSIFNVDVRLTKYTGELDTEIATKLKEVAYTILLNK